MIGLATGVLSGKADMWVKVTLMFTFAFALFITVTVPDHFLREHIWNHIVKVHLPVSFVGIWNFAIHALSNALH